MVSKIPSSPLTMCAGRKHVRRDWLPVEAADIPVCGGLKARRHGAAADSGAERQPPPAVVIEAGLHARRGTRRRAQAIMACAVKKGAGMSLGGVLIEGGLEG